VAVEDCGNQSVIGDLLLTWISESGHGTIADLRSRLGWLARTENLDLPDSSTGRWLRDIAALGHCEVDWKHGIWSAAPSVVSRLPLADGLAVLAGARRPILMRAIDANEIYVEQARRTSSAREVPLPTTILLPFDRTNDLESAANAIGARYVGCAANRIARQLPQITSLVPSAPPAYDSRLERLEKFRPRNWTPVSPRSSALPAGLYREHFHGRWQHTLRRDGGWYACDLSVGLFADLARTGESVIQWRPDVPGRSGTGTVFIDWGAPLPPLHSRALTLCSGFAPRFSTAAETAIFENVPREVAVLVCSALGQTMQTIS